MALPGDVTDAARRTRLVAAARELGGLDLRVSNASALGAEPLVRLDALPLDGLRAALETNLVAALGLAQESLPLLRASAAGTVIAVSRTAAEAYGTRGVELRTPDGRGATRPRAGDPVGAAVRLPGGARLVLEEPLTRGAARLWWASVSVGVPGLPALHGRPIRTNTPSGTSLWPRTRRSSRAPRPTAPAPWSRARRGPSRRGWSPSW